MDGKFLDNDEDTDENINWHNILEKNTKYHGDNPEENPEQELI